MNDLKGEKEISVQDELDELLEGDDASSEESEQDAPHDETDEEDDTPDTEDDESGVESVTVSFGDEDAIDDKEAPGWVKKTRHAVREQKQEIKRLRKQIKELKPDETVGEKPTLSSCDFDEDKFSSELLVWNQKKQKTLDAERKQEEKTKADEAEYAKKTAVYSDAKKTFDQSYIQEAEDAVSSAFDETQQGILIHGFSESAAALVAGLGSSEAKLAVLAEIKDPVLFTKALTQLENSMKVVRKKPKTLPESRVKGKTGVKVGVGLQKQIDAALDSNDLTEALKLQKQSRG